MKPAYFKLYESEGSRYVALFETEIENSWLRNLPFSEVLCDGWEVFPRETLIPVSRAQSEDFWILSDSALEAPNQPGAKANSVVTSINVGNLYKYHLSKIIELAEKSSAHSDADALISVSEALRSDHQDHLLIDQEIRHLYLSCLLRLADAIREKVAVGCDIARPCELAFIYCQFAKYSMSEEKQQQALVNAHYWRRASYSAFLQEINEAESKQNILCSVELSGQLLAFESKFAAAFKAEFAETSRIRG